jgi:glycosyltransferase involved in cell wall biosynthesis
MNGSDLDISVILCTRDRAESLVVTLDCLASADREGIRAELIVVDNGSHDNTGEVVRSFQPIIPVRYFYEPHLGAYGKSHALNRAIDAGELGEIVVVLDDDMSPEKDWFHGVLAICQRWPDKDLFSGHTYPIWQDLKVPEWAKNADLESWIFSACGVGADSLLEDGRWFSGNHFWFRSRVLDGGRRFKDTWLTEPVFQLELMERGYAGVCGPDAVAGHRIQPALIEREVAIERARRTGSQYASVRIQPYRKNVKQARLLAQHPVLGRAFCLLSYLRWQFSYTISSLHLSDGSRFANRLIALERVSFYREILRTVNQIPDYCAWKRRLT